VNEQPQESTFKTLLRRFWWTPIVGIPLIVLLTFAVRDFIRNTLALPLSYMLWLAEIIIQSIPQIWFWAVGLIVMLSIAMRSLDRDRRPVPAAPPASGHVTHGRLAIWNERIAMLLCGKYSRQRFGYFIGKLILDVLSYEKRLSIRDVERRLDQGELELPPAVQDYLLARLKPGLSSTKMPLFTRLKRFLGLEKPLETQLSTELESVIKFLEEQLEV